VTDYFLASEAELERLQLQARVWQTEAENMLDQIGIQSGWSCIDLGCGAMGILGPLSLRAGPSGRVVGQDIDERLLFAAQAYTQKEKLANVELLIGDVVNTTLPQDSFDLVHARFVLPHVPVDKFLEEMIRLAKPGGVVAVQEPDHSSWNFYPPCEKWKRLVGLLEDTFALQGDINIGKRTYHLLQQAGLQEVKVRAAVLALQDRHPYMRMAIVGAQAMRSRMIKAGLTTEDEFENLIQAVKQCTDDPQRIQITFTVTQVWGRKLSG